MRTGDAGGAAEGAAFLLVFAVVFLVRGDGGVFDPFPLFLTILDNPSKKSPCNVVSWRHAVNISVVAQGATLLFLALDLDAVECAASVKCRA